MPIVGDLAEKQAGGVDYFSVANLSGRKRDAGHSSHEFEVRAIRNLSVFVLIVFFALSAGAQVGNELCQAEANQPALGPGGQLEGSNNYWMVGLETSKRKCVRLESPSVKIKVHSDMSVDQDGFDFRFNVNALASAKYPNGTDASGKGPALAWFSSLHFP